MTDGCGRQAKRGFDKVQMRFHEQSSHDLLQDSSLLICVSRLDWRTQRKWNFTTAPSGKGLPPRGGSC
jgi:hypothetical protein